MIVRILFTFFGISISSLWTVSAQICPSCVEDVYLTGGEATDSDVINVLRKAAEVSWSDAAPSSESRSEIVDLLESALSGINQSSNFQLHYELTDQDLDALKNLTGFPAPDDLIRYLLFRGPSVADRLGVEEYFVHRLVPELNGTRFLIERADVPYLGIDIEYTFEPIDPASDRIPYLNENQCGNTRRINLSAVPELVLAAKAARAAELLKKNERPYALIIALEAIERAFLNDSSDLAPALQKIARETSRAVGSVAQEDSWMAERKEALEKAVPSLLLRARHFELAGALFQKQFEEGTTEEIKFEAWANLLVSKLALGKNPTPALELYSQVIKDGNAKQPQVIYFALLSRALEGEVADTEISQTWEHVVHQNLGHHPWDKLSASSLEMEKSFLWGMVLARRADLAAPFLLNRLRQTRASGSILEERYYLLKLAPFVRDFFGLISFRNDGNGRQIKRDTAGYPAYLDFLHNMRLSGKRCDLTEPGEVVISDGSFVPYGATNPEEDFATSFAGYGVISNLSLGETQLQNTPDATKSQVVSQMEEWVVASMERADPRPSAVPYMKLVALEWFATAFEDLKPIGGPTRPNYRYLPNAASAMTARAEVHKLANVALVSPEQRSLLLLFLETHATLSELYP